ncbi:DNA-binding protein [Bradyrhizobium yuanmingense]|uniref:DNA-binding protein n=2 Tax=Bradyrhizobium yuanmingense TaxID=108015 RepID=UPI0035178A2F
MPPVQGYEATVEAARRALEAAQNALAKDVGQAVVNARWAFLRDKFDVSALIDQVSELAAQPAFVAKLHASADKARNQQTPRGRPPKAITASAELKTIMQANGGASATAV